MPLKIDVFNHIFPKPFFERLQEVTVNKGAIKRWLNIPFLHDLDVRFRMIDEFGADYRQILSLSAPPIESINPDRAAGRYGGRGAWRRWELDIDVPAGVSGAVTVLARATDDRGRTQPERGEWNELGYLWDGYDRITVSA